MGLTDITEFKIKKKDRCLKLFIEILQLHALSVFFSFLVTSIGCMGCSDRDSTFDFRRQHPFSQPHPGNRSKWRAKLSEGLVSF